MKLDYDKPIFVYYTDNPPTQEDLKKFTDAGMQIILLGTLNSYGSDSLECIYGGKYHNYEKDLNKINQLIGKINQGIYGDIKSQLEGIKKIITRSHVIDEVLK